MDEAHKLRNVYKSNNVTGKKLKLALQGAKKKLLLTATPLQNNLMELYGLTSLIDDHVFGDEKTFREMYIAVTNTAVRNRSLRARLQNFCNPYTQEDMLLLANNINSIRRESLGNKSPYEATTDKSILRLMELMGLHTVPADEVNLTPALLKR